MADNRKLYEVPIGGIPHTLKLNDDDAARYKAAYGDKFKEAKPATKGRTPANKGA